jgi:NTE family protein
MAERTRCTLVLGGGGLRGLAHVGVLRALEEHHIQPAEVIGCSVGALVGAAWCAGLPARELTTIAHQLQRDDLFRLAHGDMALRRMRSPAIFRREPLADFIRGLLDELTFADLQTPLLVNTVDINSGTQVFWGTRGLTDVLVADAVIASCAMPGFLPPHRIRGRYFVDGAASGNLPVHPAAREDRDLVIAVDVSSRGRPDLAVQRQGFAAVWARAIELGIQRMDEVALRRWSRPPLLLIRPAVWHVDLLSFRHNAALVEAGYRATHAVLDAPHAIPTPSDVGVFPRHRVRVEVLREECVGCGACVASGPAGQFHLDADGKAVPTDPTPLWSPIDGLSITLCPTNAIVAHPVEPVTASVSQTLGGV